jgi:hypothetical protein
MTELLSLPWYVYVVPCCAIAISIFVSKLLRISQFVALLGACAPLSLPYTEVPLLPQFALLKPAYQIVGAWGVLFAAALGWVLVRAVVRGAAGPFGIFRFGYMLVLCSALGVVGLLIGNPALLNEHAPGWRGAGGLVLLCATTLSMSIAFVRVFKTAALLALWSFASLVLASEIFFQKMPQELVKDDLLRIEDQVKTPVMRAAIRRVSLSRDDGGTFSLSRALGSIDED